MLMVCSSAEAFSVPKLSQLYKGASLALITPKILAKYEPIESIRFLADRGVKAGRIPASQMLSIQNKFTSIPSGEKILLQCLKNSACKPSLALKRMTAYKNRHGHFPSPEISQMIARDDLYYKLTLKEPHLSPTQLKLKAGAVAEKVMDSNFLKSGWSKIEGEVGRNGFDGLYVKLDRYGNVKSTMIMESKYGKAQLKKTVDGATQMSQKWSLKKIDALIKKYPNDPNYRQIKAHIVKGNVKYRIYRLQANNNKLHQTIEKIIPSESNVSISKLNGGEKYQANYSQNIEIDVNSPKGSYQKALVEAYSHSL